MRICLYTTTAHPKLGGQEAVVDALARHFTAMGHRAVVLTPAPRSPLRARDGELPYPVVRHPRFVSTRHFVSFYRRWLVNLHAREHFDVIHCHDVYPTGYLAVLAREQLGVPIVFTSHGGDIKEGNVRIIKPGMRPRYIRAAESADALIAIGNFTTEAYRKLSTNLPPIVPIPNGIDLEPFQTPAPRPASLDPAIQSDQYVLFLGRLAKRKGVDVLTGAMAKLPGGKGVQCVIAGTGDEQAGLEARAGQLGLRDRVRFVGRVDGTDKLWLLQNARCVAMPSRVWEAFPLVLIESYAAGKPVVGSAIPGIADLVEEGRTGLLVPEESPDALAAALRTLVDHPERVREMGHKCRQFAQGYSWRAVAVRHIELYQQIIAARKANASDQIHRRDAESAESG